jgi:tetratricopeptide (TPR) repeat protein
LAFLAVVVGREILVPQSRTLAQDPVESVDPEVERQRQIVERFITVLERNPRRGTALDRIYGNHIENGTLGELVKRFTDRTIQDPKDGVAWMILGLVESQRGRDAAAVEAFSHAKDLRANDPMAAFYFGQSLILVGNPDQAVVAFEEAIARKPAQGDLLSVFQALGRVHQQAQHVDKALAVWTRLEKLFPDNPRVQEDIAATLVEEGQFAEALPRYESLARQATDDYRKTVFRMQAADLKMKTKRAAEGIADLEDLLKTLNPQNWLFREVRHHIEEVYLRTNDDDGLAKYYQRWLESNPEDIDAMSRLARVLARQARVPEAQTWLDKALRLAPSRKELRLAFIDQLVDEQRYADAIAQYAELDKVDANNPDYLRNWGKLILRDSARPKPDRHAEAEKVWRRMTAARPNDPLIAAQVADLFRYAEMTDQALELYQKAVELAPTSPQYREYLGEYYHILKRPDEALDTWRQLTAGPQRTAVNTTRLAEVLAQFGYLEQALPEIAEACRLDAKDFSLQLKAADMQIRGNSLDDALASLERAETLAQNDEEHEAVLAQQLKVYTLEGRLTQLCEQLRKEIEAGKATARRWYLLARYQEELRDYPEANTAIRKANELEPGSIPVLASAARVAELSGELEQAAVEQRKLAVIDRRGRTDHLRHVAELESQIGRVDAALSAGRELIAAAPGNVDTHQFFADLCFRLGKPDEALTTLRRAVRANPNDQNILLALASALAAQFRSDEAIELYWQAFEKATELDDRLSVVGKLTDLYLQTNHFDRLLERLERNRQEAENRRELTICLAQAHQSAGDYGMARQELERLLNENSRDTHLLQQLSKLAEAEADMTSAAAFQEQVAKIAPGPEAEYRLATLLSRAGRSQEAAEILVRLTAKEEDKEKLLRNIDGLLSAQEYETALNAIEPKLRENPKDWELLYRDGVARFHRRPDAAEERFQAILTLDTPDEEQGTAAKNREKARQKQSSTAKTATRVEYPFARIERAGDIQRAVGLSTDSYYSASMARATTWTPQQYSQARMAALGWLVRLSQKNGNGQELIDRFRNAAEKTDAPSRALWDWVYLESVRGSDQKELLPIARRLAVAGDVAGHYLHLGQLMSRNSQSLQAVRSGRQGKDMTAQLKPNEIELAMRSFDAVERAMGGVNASTASSMRILYSQIILAELKRAGRDDEAKQIYTRTLERATTSQELTSVMQLVIARMDIPALLTVFDRFAKREIQERNSKAPPQAYIRQQVAQVLATAIIRKDVQQRDVIEILNRYLKYQSASSNARRNDPRSKTRTATRSSQPNYINLPTSSGFRNVLIAYPVANQYFDSADLSLWRSVYEWFKQKDLHSDLMSLVEEQVKSAGPTEKLYATLAVGYLNAWNEDTAAAIKALTAATALEPREADLRLDLAQYCLQSQQLEDAIAQLDALTPSNQTALRDREMLALDVAVRLGDLERARQAAQRLFGLRLDAETQIQLAGKMRRLGMTTEAEAIMARAQRHAGSSLTALAALLGQYQSEGRTDLAAEVAHQILRRSRTAPVAQQAMGYNTADSMHRTSALQILAQSGKLKEIIARVESQLERSPQSTQLSETLAEYYTAAGDSKKSLELQGKVVEQQPEDADLRFRYAQVLANGGRNADACEQYKLALTKKPSLLQNRSYEVVRAFQQVKREAELAKFVGTLDLKSINNPYGVMDLVRNMFNNKDNRDAGLELLKKAWAAFPAQRSQLLQSFYDDAIWKLPEVFEYGRQALLPTPEAISQYPWSGLDVVMSFNQDGRVNCALDKVLTAAVNNNELEKLRAQVAEHSEKHLDWHGGKVLLAVIDLRLKKPVDVPAAIKPLLDASTDDYRSVYARWIVGQEIETRPELRSLAIELYKSALENRNNIGNQFQYSPGPRLVKAYLAEDQREEARKLLVAAARERADERYDPSYASYQRVENMQSIAKQLQEANFSVDALRVYRDFLTDNSIDSTALQQYGGRDLSTLRKEAQARMDAIIAKLSGAAGAAALGELLTAQDNSDAADSAIDLLISATPAGNELPRIDSLVVRFLESAKLNVEATTELQTKLDALAMRRPRDFSVAVAQSLVALKTAEPTQKQVVIERLTELVASLPLETLPDGQRSNARQRTDAMRQVGLWLTAKACLAEPTLRAVGVQLADRAVAAASRQLDPSLAVAMLHERGLLSLDAGSIADAEQDWNQLLELAIIRPRAQSSNRTSVSVPGAPSSAVPNPSAAKATDTKPRAPRGLDTPPVTLSQFKIGAALSQLAANRDLPVLSLRAIREVLAGGLPVADISTQMLSSRPRQIVRTRSGTDNSRNDVDQQIYEELATRMWQVSAVWEKKGILPKDVCELLEQLVFPANRPTELLLFEQPLGEDWWTPKSIGRLLATWSLRAGRGEPLAKLVEARQGSPTAILSGHVLSVQYHLAAADEARARSELKAIGALVESGKVTGWAETAVHAIGPSFIDSRLTADAAPLLAKALTTIKSASMRYDGPRDDSPLSRLIRFYLRHGEFKSAQSVVDEYIKRRQAEYARYGGDSPLVMQRTDLTWAANELCRGNQMQTTLDILGKVADTPATASSQIQLTRALWQLTRQLGKLPPEDRYLLLRDWTLPTENRRSVRMLVTFEGGQPVPNAFLSADDIRHDPLPKFAPISNLQILVDAAREAGKLDELSEANEKLIKDKVPGANTLGILTAIARNDTAGAKKRISDMVAQIRRELVINASRAASDWSPIVVVHAAIQDPSTSQAGESLLQLLTEVTQNDRFSQLGAWMAYAGAQHRLRAAGERELVDSPHLKHWIATSGSRASGALRPPTLWAADEGCVKRVCGSELDQLVFRYPLSGEFELTGEARIGEPLSCNFSYAGIGFMPTGVDELTLQTLAGNDTMRRGQRSNESTINPPHWRRISLKVSDGKARFSIRGWPVFEDRSPSPTSPWFGMFAVSNQQSLIRNLKIQGAPTIPRQVKLVDGNRLEGWAAGLGSTMQPSATLMAALGEGRVVSGLSESRQAATRDAAYDWTAESGVLRGRNSADALASSKGWLHYHRPLLDGESLRYQFYYKPGERHVHPTVGRIAFLLDPAALRLRWLQMSSSASGIVALEPDTTIDDPAVRRVAVSEVLRADDWNDVEVNLVGEEVTLRLNGQPICQRSIDAPGESYFGFYYLRGESAAEIRNVELTGPWPQSLSETEMANLLAPTDEIAPAEVHHAREKLVGEAIVAQNAEHVLQQEQKPEPAERYEFLKKWILPSELHRSFRLQSDVAANGHEIAPVLELSLLARQLGKADDLTAAIAKAAAEFPDDKSSIAALQLVAAVARDDSAAATAGLATMQKQVKQRVQDARGQWPHAELIAAEAALATPQLRPQGLALAAEMAGMANNKNLDRTDWQRVASHLVAQASEQLHEDRAAAVWKFTQWQPVNRVSALSRVLGHPASAWRVDEGQVRYFTSHGQDALYFFLPLAGNFEVRFEQKSSKQRGLALLYGGISFNVSGDATLLVRQDVGRGTTTKPLEIKLGKDQEWNEYRLVVQDGKLSVLIGGVQIASEQLPSDPDPWLALQSSERNFIGSIRGLQILGQPKVLSEIRLSSERSLSGWHADYYRESFSPDGFTSRDDRQTAEPAWTKQADEVVGSMMAQADGSGRESLLQYHRPLMDGSVLEYEFFWEAGKIDCHPALDRLAILLSPEGVQTHQMTDGQFDRTDIAADYPTALANSKLVVLKTREWNRARISLEQSIATIAVNGQDVATIALDPSSQHVFGLFHYRDTSQSRVRNVVLRGNWPTRVPPLDEQQLAREPTPAE